ncbi:MAG: hypothetical protein H7A23_09325 [Leptospiraceae bacterium]|nr:hypothetical protein [Leptospiraceae bacterium]MCP5494744.1 hypothetical protein [Leptospiraceae bacterium]
MNSTDFKQLFKCIAADFKMIAMRTGLKTESECDKILHDINLFLCNDFLSQVFFVVDDRYGKPLRVKKYIINFVNRSTNDRPGDNDWDDIEAESLYPIISHNETWNSLSENQKNEFQKGLKLNWSPSDIDTDFPHLRGSMDKKYTSNDIGIDRISYE